MKRLVLLLGGILLLVLVEFWGVKHFFAGLSTSAKERVVTQDVGR